jgi:hypothetical protein
MSAIVCYLLYLNIAVSVVGAYQKANAVHRVFIKHRSTKVVLMVFIDFLMILT